ncbi:MAG TPA: TonB-dependent receptor [Longimicrobiales bacterium]|nr:TonB-dependent receptor [Longimicrobiales bacterium]
MASKLQTCFHALLAMSLFVAAPAWAQNGTITGVITEGETGRPLTSARVDAQTGGRSLASTLTNAEGRYSLSVPAGSYTLSVETVGFEATRSPVVTVTAGGSSVMDVSLRTSAFVLNPVVVSASRGRQEKATETVSHTEVVSELEIAQRPAVTPVDHLRSVPAVDVITTGVQSTNVAVRGFNNIFSGSLHTLTDNRIAGVPSLRVNLMHFVPQTNDDIARMEVVLGPGSALYGPNTANGVLHIITKSPLDDQGTTVSIAGGERSMLHGTLRTSQKLSDRFGIKVSGQYLRAEEWEYFDDVELATRELATSTDPADQAQFRAGLPLDVDNTPLTEAEIQARIARIGNRDFDITRWSGDLRADWQVTNEVTAIFSAGLTNSGTGVELTGIGAGQVKDWKYGYYQGRVNWRRLFAQAYLNTSDAGDTFLLRSGAPIIDKSKVFVSQLQHGFDLGGRQDFTYGLDFISTMPETERTINGAREDEDNYTEFGAYLQSRTDLTSQLSIVLAGRADQHSELDKWVFSPRAALIFSPFENQSFRASYNRAFSTPSSLNLFLDIDGGPAPSALGQLGFRLRAQGPGAEGISFRDTSGDLYGIRSPFAPAVGMTSTDLLDPTPVTLYDLQREGFFGAAAAQGQPIPAALQTYLRTLRNDPALNAIGTSIFDPVLNTRTALSATALQPIPGIEESRNETYELGYQGVIANRLVLAADAWLEKRENFVSPLILQSPLALLTPEQFVPFIVQRVTPVFIAQGMTPTDAQAQATALGTQMASVPGGVFSSPDINAAGADVLVTYRNFGEVDIHGFDVSASYLVTDKLQVGATASLISDYYFNLPLEGGADQPVALNAPKEKGTANITYRDTDRGFNGELRARFNGEFPANSAGYIGLQCIDAAAAGPCVKSYTLLDLNVGYELRQMPGASIQLNISNLLDEEYQSFIGVATVGRLALLRLRYEF